MAAAPQPLEERIRVLVADDEQLFVEMVEAMLAPDPRIDVVAHAYNGQEAVERALSHEPDVTLMDIAMPHLDGIQAIEQIRERDPYACILVLTGANNPTDIDQARKAGAAGYLTKDRIATELLPAIHDLGSR
jgi:two-component system, NarL family, response regulator